jgi:hypothetical protein
MTYVFSDYPELSYEFSFSKTRIKMAFFQQRLDIFVETLTIAVKN